MRTSVFVGMSLDGFIARPDGRFDFLSGADGEPHGYEEFMATVDAIVMGRNTFETVLPFPTWPYGDKPVFVLSSHPLSEAASTAMVERLDGQPAEILTRLAERGFEHVYVDGGNTVQRFLRAGLIDRITITRVPVLIGRGISLFGALDADVFLTHLVTRQLADGSVQSEYAVGRSAAAPGADRGREDELIVALHHVQLAMPRGGEAQARNFFVSVLGMTEKPKPENLARRGGVWFSSGSAEVHLGVEDDFRAALKAHPALLVASLERIVDRCHATGFETTTDEPLAGFARAYVKDPFGNRIELLERR